MLNANRTGDLSGVIDSHVHVYPEISLKVPNAADDHEWIREAAAAGMRAVCLKSHYWPTVDKAYTLGKWFPEIGVYGGIVLNITVGGFNPLAVQVAIENGAKVVWFPTWSAANDIEKKGYSRRVASTYGSVPAPHLTVVDSKGRLLAEVEAILHQIAKGKVALATGHLSVQESKVLVRAAREHGIDKIVLTHALTSMIDATIEEQKEMAALGVKIEHCFVATQPKHQQLSPDRIAEGIKAVGAEHCVISSDAVFAWNPTAPEMMRMFMAALAERGIEQREIDWMTKRNPESILGIEERASQ